MCNKPGRLRVTAAMHNRKPDRTEETRGNFQLPDVQRVLPPDSRCSALCLRCQRLGSSSSRLQRGLLWVFFRFKGVEAPSAVVFILPNKSEHTQAGLDSHLKTLYSLTLVLLFSLSFSQSKAWPAHSMWFICLLGCLCQIGNISKHLQPRFCGVDVITALQALLFIFRLSRAGRGEVFSHRGSADRSTNSVNKASERLCLHHICVFVCHGKEEQEKAGRGEWDWNLRFCFAREERSHFCHSVHMLGLSQHLFAE